MNCPKCGREMTRAFSMSSALTCPVCITFTSPHGASVSIGAPPGQGLRAQSHGSELRITSHGPTNGLIFVTPTGGISLGDSKPPQTRPQNMKRGDEIEVRVYRQIWAPAKVLRVAPPEFDAEVDDGGIVSMDIDNQTDWRPKGGAQCKGDA